MGENKREQTTLEDKGGQIVKTLFKRRPPALRPKASDRRIAKRYARLSRKSGGR